MSDQQGKLMSQVYELIKSSPVSKTHLIAAGVRADQQG